MKVSGPARAACARLVPDRALDHPDVTVAPFRDPFIEVDEALADLGALHVAAIDIEQDLLNLWCGLNWFRVVTRQM